LLKTLAYTENLWYNRDMKCIFIYNPNSGKGRIAKKLAYIQKRLRTQYEVVDVYATKAKGDLTEKVKEVADLYDLIIFSGGDGTFNEVLQGVGDRKELPRFGYIPGGTANDVAHSLKIPRKSVRGALNVILQGREEKLDCMCINDKDYAIYSVSAGAFTSATYMAPQKSKRAFGILAYGFEGIKNNLAFKVFSARAEAEGKTWEGDCVFLLCMNGKCVAGMKMNPTGSMIDGRLEAAVIDQKHKPKFFDKITALFKVVKLFLFGYHFKEKKHYLLKGETIRYEVPEDVVWNYDGERGCTGSVEIKVVPKKFPLIIPKNNKNI